MKVGILTFHRAENFGAALQVYALQSFLQKKGCDVDVIDYRNLAIESMYDIYNPRILFTRKNIFISLRLYINRFKHIQDRFICKDKYQKFREKFLRLTKKTTTLKDVIKVFDCVIVGSDQVWNLHLTGGLDKNYFLGFEKNHGVKKISYAVSAEYDPCDLLCQHKSEITKWLSDFDSISVREEFLKTELRKYTDKRIAVCLDPTFLLNDTHYKGMVPTPLDKRYILVYHMTPIPMGTELADRIAEAKNYKVIEIHIGYGCGHGDERHKTNLGPLEILNYIVWAEEIVTSSFHGLALSLIMKKDVWVIDKGNNQRQRNLLASLGLGKRLLTDLRDYKDNKIDYGVVSNLLDVRIKESKDFIMTALFGENEENSVLS